MAGKGAAPLALTMQQAAILLANEMVGGAERLREDDVLVTRTFGGQICRPEIVNLVDRASRGLRGFVSLGEFVPYTIARD